MSHAYIAEVEVVAIQRRFRLVGLPRIFFIAPDAEGTFRDMLITVCPLCHKKAVQTAEDGAEKYIHAFQRGRFSISPYLYCLVRRGGV